MPIGVYERPSPESRFWARVERGEDCWRWTGCVAGSHGSYGVLSIDRRQVGTCGKGHEYTPANTYTHKGGRRCRLWHRDTERIRKARVKAEAS